MAHCVCITGTDTDAGKTVITAALVRLAGQKGLRTLVIKPVQTGAFKSDASLAVPDMAPDLQLCASIAPSIETIAIELFEDACSPHLAAEKSGRRLDAGEIAKAVRNAVSGKPWDLVILEGAGGLLTPLNEEESLCDLFALLGWPLLLVAANRLGGVNHTLLSLDVARLRGLTCLGFILNETSAASGLLAADIRRDNARIIWNLGRAACLADIAFEPGLSASCGNDGAWDRICAALEPVLKEVTGIRQPSEEPEAAVLDDDRAHIWHPYTSALTPLRARLAVGTEGVRIRLRDGRELIDGMASWWCAIHGYRPPRLMDALYKQAAAMPHVMFGGLTHEPAVTLARKLLGMAPSRLEHVFFADSGSVSVEVAIKMALQYQQAAGQKQRTRLLTVRGGYHGDTFGAMSVCDPETGMHGLFTGMLPPQIFAPRPSCRYDAPYDPASTDEFELLLRENADATAAVILEPIVQGAGGMWFYHPDYLRRVAELSADVGCLLILDEIATGFGRTGTLFACEQAGVSPDIMCVGKGLTGGVMSLAATLSTARVAKGISQDGGVLMHGPTFMGNPLACAVAAASLELLEENDWQKNVQRIEEELRSGLAPCRDKAGVADVRVLGAIGVVETESPVNTEKLQTYCVERHGVWIRPFGRLIYVMPPYIASNKDVAALTAAICGAIEKDAWR